MEKFAEKLLASSLSHPLISIAYSRKW